MSSLKTIEKRVFEDLLDMGGGYVLDQALRAAIMSLVENRK